MNREIKFKAKRVDNGDWVYGYYFKCNTYNKTYIYDLEGLQIRHEVIPETVCQFITTIDGVAIYENDKLKGDDDLCVYCLIEWSEQRGRFEVNDYGYGISYGEGSQEIISNDICLVDENIYDIEDIDIKDLTGNKHD